MLQGIRTFVHWVDGLLHADCTMDKCDDVYKAVNDQLEAEEKAAKAKREELGVYKDLLVSLAPSIIQLFSKSFGAEPDSSHVQVGRTSCCQPSHLPGYPTYAYKPEIPRHDGERPVVVDREDQGGERKPVAAGPQPSVLSPAVVEAAFKAFHKTITELNARVSNLEAVATRSKPIQPPVPGPAAPPASE